ncbi:MAG: 16S rRNA (guanine(527)-N(7))-methyltransferase RsmG [Bacteroidia bacterium]
MSTVPTSVPNFSSLAALLSKYFPDAINEAQMDQFRRAFEAYVEWNARINVISRKDMDNLAERHFLHSLAIAKSVQFKSGTKVLDVGTGGGFPGIPLAIFFPETHFHLVDSRQKKIHVVEQVAQATDLKNVQWTVQRAEELTGQYDFVVSRAVASLDQFIPWIRKRVHCRQQNEVKNGILYLRGADGIKDEIQGMGLPHPPKITAISDWFEEEFFETKHLVHLALCQ